MRILICAGGTGGGIYPALAAAAALKTQGVATKDMVWIGTRGEMEEELVPQAGIELVTISGGGVVGVSPLVALKNGLRLLASLPKALTIVKRFKPAVMLMTGGYMAAPVTVAARLRGVPICIYLPDVEPGKSIRFSVPFAKKIAATTGGSAHFVPPEKLVVTGYPVRPSVRQALALTQAEALAQFDLQSGRPTLFVWGGSRGAWAINQALMGCLPQLLERTQVIHISGTLTWPQVEENIAKLSDNQRRFYRPFPYLHDRMGAAFRAADLVLSRAGASMLGEGPAFGLPAILVPLTFAWRYQKVNADYLTERGAAVQLTDEQLETKMAPTILGLLDDPERLERMRQAARALDKPDAAERLAQVILECAEAQTHD